MSNVAVIIAADNLMLTLNSVMNGPSPAGRGEGGGGKRTAESFEILISLQIRRRAPLKSSEMVSQSRHGSDEAGGSVFVFFRMCDKQADVMRTSEGLQQKGNYFEKTLLATLYYY